MRVATKDVNAPQGDSMPYVGVRPLPGAVQRHTYDPSRRGRSCDFSILVRTRVPSIEFHRRTHGLSRLTPLLQMPLIG